MQLFYWCVIEDEGRNGHHVIVAADTVDAAKTLAGAQWPKQAGWDRDKPMPDLGEPDAVYESVWIGPWEC